MIAERILPMTHCPSCHEPFESPFKLDNDGEEFQSLPVPGIDELQPRTYTERKVLLRAIKDDWRFPLCWDCIDKYGNPQAGESLNARCHKAVRAWLVEEGMFPEQ